jgi:hypothetical protein
MIWDAAPQRRRFDLGVGVEKGAHVAADYLAVVTRRRLTGLVGLLSLPNESCRDACVICSSILAAWLAWR